MIKHHIIKTIYFTTMWIFISAADLKQHDVSENTDLSFLENDPKRENWIDPFNMFEYKPSINNLETSINKYNEKTKEIETGRKQNDKASKGMIAKKNPEQSANDRTVTTDNINEMNDDGKVCEFATQQVFSDDNADSNLCKDEEFIYLKRTANMVLNKVKALKQNLQSSVLNVKLTITEKTIDTLKVFLGSPCKHIQEFDSVISVTLNNAELTETRSYIELIYTYIHLIFHSENVSYCIILFMAISLWGRLLRSSIKQIITRLIIYVFILSFAWNWKLLVTLETANAYAKAEKTGPNECRNENPGIYKKILVILNSVFFSSSDGCKEYYEALLVEPIWKVSPVLVLSTTLSELFFHPLGLLGQHLGSFFQNLFSAVSWYLLMPVCFIVTLSILLLLLMVFGYRIKLPFLCTIEPGHQQYTREQYQLISDVLEGRVLIQRTDSIQNINVSERITYCSNCSNANNAMQKAVMKTDEQKMKNVCKKGTQRKVIEPSSLSSLCYDRLINGKLNGKIQELEKIASNLCNEKTKVG